MSKLFVDEIVHQSSQGSGTITLGTSGESVTVPSGATLNVSGTPGTGIRMKPFFKVYKSANQNLTNDSATLITHNGVVYNADSVYDTSTGKFTVPTGEAGTYWLYFSTRVTGSSANQFKYATGRFYVNGTAEEYMQHYYHTTSGNMNNDVLAYGVAKELAEGDEVQVYVTLTVFSGTPILVGSSSSIASTSFTGFKLIGI